MEAGIIQKLQKAYMYLPKDFSSDPHNNIQDVISPEHELVGEEIVTLRNSDSDPNLILTPTLILIGGDHDSERFPGP